MPVPLNAARWNKEKPISGNSIWLVPPCALDEWISLSAISKVCYVETTPAISAILHEMRGCSSILTRFCPWSGYLYLVPECIRRIAGDDLYFRIVNPDSLQRPLCLNWRGLLCILYIRSQMLCLVAEFHDIRHRNIQRQQFRMQRCLVCKEMILRTISLRIKRKNVDASHAFLFGCQPILWMPSSTQEIRTAEFSVAMQHRSCTYPRHSLLTIVAEYEWLLRNLKRGVSDQLTNDGSIKLCGVDVGLSTPLP